MELIETIHLQNGLILTITDFSRNIAADTAKVEISFQVKVKVLDSYFNTSEDHRLLTDIFGDELTYERKIERAFVFDRDEASVRADILATFKANSLNYLSSPNFARKMTLSVLRDIRQNPYKYQGRPAEPAE